MANPKAFDRVDGMLEVHHFADPVHGFLFESAARRIRAGGIADMITLAGEFGPSGLLDPVGGVPYLATLLAGLVSPSLAGEYGKAIVDAWARREIIEAAESMVAKAFDSGDVSALLAGSAAAVEAVALGAAMTGGRSKAKSLGEAIDAALAQADAVLRGEGTSGVMTGMATIDAALGGMENGDLVVLGGRPGSGKAQPLDAKVLLADGGWARMGDIQRGDRLASTDGGESLVVAVHDRGTRPVLRVTFRDGRSTEVCSDHLWSIWYRDWSERRTISTEKLAEMLTRKRYRGRLSIESVSGEFGNSNLPLDPYVLGVLLGDGSFRGSTVKLTSADSEIVNEVQRRLGISTEVRKVRGSYAYSLTSRSLPGRITEDGRKHGREVWRRTVYPIRDAVRDLGLSGLLSHDKFIPPQYFSACRADRLDLLKGMLDTDGTVGRLGSITFASCSRMLADGVQALVRSLGGQCKISDKQTGCMVAGKYKFGLPSFVCNIRHPNGETLLFLQRKSDRARRGRNSSVPMTVSSVLPSRATETRCITVSHPNGLYVTDNYIVTHNSSLAWQWAIDVARRGGGVLAVSMEMTASALGRRALSIASGVPIWRMKKAQHEEDMGALLAARRELLMLPLSIEDGGRTSAAEMFGMARAARRKHGLSMIVVDHLQIAKPDDQDQRNGSTAAVAGVAHAMKELAKRMECPVVLLSQLNRALESRDDHRPTMADLRQAGAIEEDADIVAFVYRPELHMAKSAPEQTDRETGEKYQERVNAWHARKAKAAGTAEFIIEKLRDGETTMVPLLFDGPTTTFRQRAEAEQ